MNDRRLVELSLAEFVAAVGSSERAAPAAGSVAALTGASAAGLAELACSVTDEVEVKQAHEAAQRLQRDLLALVEADAVAVTKWLATPPRSEARRAVGRTAAGVPLDIARRCTEVAELAKQIQPRVAASVRADAGAARTLASAAARTALSLVEANLQFAADRQATEAEIEQLRERLG